MPAKTIEEQQKARRIAYNKTFNTPEGRIVLSHLVKHFGLLITKFDEDQRHADYSLGQRDVVAHILNEMGIVWQFDIEKTGQMQQQEEASDERRADDSIGPDAFERSTPTHPLDL